MAAYKMRDIGELKWFLGIQVTRDRLRRRIWLSQDSYIQKICAQYSISLDSRKSPKTPLPSGSLTQYEDTATPHEIRGDFICFIAFIYAIDYFLLQHSYF
jgi:hypothetical protein